jgi:peptidoglycan hydrolase-like protein with peptidoglycan-binding domain
VQLALLLQGDYDGAIDGVMGPATRDAIDIFKIKRGLPRGGYLDKATLDALGVPLRSK